MRKLVIDQFVLRQFDKTKPNSNLILCTPQEIEDYCNKIYNTQMLKDGYAPFCKHLFIKNFTETKTSMVLITPENEHLLKCEYEARTPQELPVLRRYFPKEKFQQIKQAEYLDIILYSKEQIMKENKAMNQENDNDNLEYDYGIISIKPQDSDYEIPMEPITMMRNTLISEGGSGVALDRVKYLQSVEHWSKYAVLK